MRAPAEGSFAISVALAEELRALRPLLEKAQPIQLGEWRGFSGRLGSHPVILFQTGMGQNRARQASLQFLSALKPRALVAVGFAGGASEAVKTGDVVIADPLFDPPRPEGDGPRQLPADPRLLEAARRVTLPEGRVHCGRMVGVKEVLSTPGEKHGLSDRHGALAFDMESLGAAKAANVHDTPLLCARAIVDEASTLLPFDLGRFIAPSGRLRLAPLCWSCLSRPRALPALADLARRAKIARRNLSAFIQAFFQKL